MFKYMDIEKIRRYEDLRMARNLSTYMAFIDVEKAFDIAKWEHLFKLLKKTGVKYRDRRVIWNL